MPDSHKRMLQPLRAVPIQSNGEEHLIGCKRVRKALNVVPSIQSFRDNFQQTGLMDWPRQIRHLTDTKNALTWVDGLQHGRLVPIPIDTLGATMLSQAEDGKPLLKPVTAAEFPGIKVFRRSIPPNEIIEFQHEVQAVKDLGGVVEKVVFHGSYLGNWDAILRTRLQPGDAERGATMGEGIYGAEELSVAAPYCRVNEYPKIPNIIPRSWEYPKTFYSGLGRNPYIMGVFKACLDPNAKQHGQEHEDIDDDSGIHVARSSQRALLGYLISIDFYRYMWTGFTADEQQAFESVATAVKSRFDS